MKQLSFYFSLLLLGSTLFSCTEEDLAKFLGHIDGNEKQHFVTTLNGANEIPEAVHTRATGQLTLEVSEDGEKIKFALTVADLDNYLAGHIHVGEDSVNGPVVAWVFPIEPYPFTDFIDDPLVPGTSNGVLSKGVLTADNLVGPLEGMSLDALVSELKAGNAYVNLHTSQFPAGEIRGNF